MNEYLFSHVIPIVITCALMPLTMLTFLVLDIHQYQLLDRFGPDTNAKPNYITSLQCLLSNVFTLCDPVTMTFNLLT